MYTGYSRLYWLEESDLPILPVKLRRWNLLVQFGNYCTHIENYPWDSLSHPSSNSSNANLCQHNCCSLGFGGSLPLVSGWFMHGFGPSLSSRFVLLWSRAEFGLPGGAECDTQNSIVWKAFVDRQIILELGRPTLGDTEKFRAERIKHNMIHHLTSAPQIGIEIWKTWSNWVWFWFWDVLGIQYFNFATFWSYIVCTLISLYHDAFGIVFVVLSAEISDGQCVTALNICSPDAKKVLASSDQATNVTLKATELV